jgi:hypothetical protein
MHYRFTATKEAFELNSINKIQENKTVTIKQEDDYKGISFSLVCDRFSDTSFLFTCYHKGVFNILDKEFKVFATTEPFSVLNTLLYKELFSFEYTTDSSLKLKDTTSTSLLKFKFVELFENEDAMLMYIKQFVSNFGWSIEYKDQYEEVWQTYIID